MRLTVPEVLEATGGTLERSPEAETLPDLITYHTDSRQVTQGGLFFALRGSAMDGHQFVADAAAHGATAAIVERRLDEMSLAQVVVGDSWQALYDVARWVLEKAAPLVVGVTGSNGKTSTKELTAAALSVGRRVLKSEGNLNTETGLPLTILRLDPDEHDALVLEMGLQKPGDIARLARLARPQVGVVTGIGSVHLEFFGSREEIAREKGELLRVLPEAGAALLNAEDEFFDLLSSLASAPVRSFGFERGDLRAEAYEPIPGGSSFRAGGTDVKLSMPGRHQVQNALAALLVAEKAGIGIAEAAPALAAVRVEHRMQELVAPSGLRIVDDAYNASPESMLAAFSTMAERTGDGPLLAVLGEMRELGSVADEAHRRIGARAAEVFDAVCVVDVGLGRVMAAAAGAYLAPDKPAAARWALEHGGGGGTVLVKGSHGVALEDVVAALMQRN
jgi:UDP-N-acetylmuramoyl-tripeptide--D-alanyl-D-alanine ligase